MKTVRAVFMALPGVLRFAFVGAVVLGLPGGIAGLIIGFPANPGTAWFAIFELGTPSSVLGFVLGLGVGTVAVASRRLARHVVN